MVRTKLTVRRWPRISHVLPLQMKRGRRGQVKKPFKIKLTQPEQKTGH